MCKCPLTLTLPHINSSFLSSVQTKFTLVRELNWPFFTIFPGSIINITIVTYNLWWGRGTETHGQLDNPKGPPQTQQWLKLKVLLIVFANRTNSFSSKGSDKLVVFWPFLAITRPTHNMRGKSQSPSWGPVWHIFLFTPGPIGLLPTVGFVSS